MNTGTVCVVCNQQNPPGATRCLKCTAPLRVSATVILSEQLKQEIARESRTYQGKMEPGSIALHLVGRRDPLLVDVDDEVILGRHMGGDSPNVVDLTPYRAGLLGVSRRHAIIQATEDGYTIEDLGSTNGTWVNENRLPEETPYVLASGDCVRLGELILYVFFRPA